MGWTKTNKDTLFVVGDIFRFINESYDSDYGIPIQITKVNNGYFYFNSTKSGRDDVCICRECMNDKIPSGIELFYE